MRPQTASAPRMKRSRAASPAMVHCSYRPIDLSGLRLRLRAARREPRQHQIVKETSTDLDPDCSDLRDLVVFGRLVARVRRPVVSPGFRTACKHVQELIRFVARWVK